jgi:hypothetical protein
MVGRRRRRRSKRVVVVVVVVVGFVCVYKNKEEKSLCRAAIARQQGRSVQLVVVVFPLFLGCCCSVFARASNQMNVSKAKTTNNAKNQVHERDGSAPPGNPNPSINKSINQ